MKKHSRDCDQGLLNRYYDNELHPDELERAEIHIRSCPGCRRALDDLEEISGQVRDHVSRQTMEFPDLNVERHVLDKIGKSNVPWRTRVKEAFFSKRVIIPATAAVAVALVLFTVLRPVVQAGPSAIIKSISGDVSNIIILETPHTRQTILWFEERTERQNS